MYIGVYVYIDIRLRPERFASLGRLPLEDAAPGANPHLYMYIYLHVYIYTAWAGRLLRTLLHREGPLTSQRHSASFNQTNQPASIYVYVSMRISIYTALAGRL